MRTVLIAVVALGTSSAVRANKSPCSKPPEGMVCIPGGEFIRGSDTGRPEERPAGKVHVDAFLIDRHEVTHAEYQECMKANACGRARPYYRGFNRPRQPMLGVSWFNAREFCVWKKKRLPTEAEWEKAARGPSGATYSWGNERATCARAVFMDNKGKGCGTGKTFDVGSRPAGAYGLFDMSGNSWEWVNDWYSRSYTACGKACASPNPKGPCAGADECPKHRYRIVKGGSWWWPATDMRGARRRLHYPTNKPYHHFGFRCAKDAVN